MRCAARSTCELLARLQRQRQKGTRGEIEEGDGEDGKGEKEEEEEKGGEWGGGGGGMLKNEIGE